MYSNPKYSDDGQALNADIDIVLDYTHMLCVSLDVGHFNVTLSHPFGLCSFFSSFPLLLISLFSFSPVPALLVVVVVVVVAVAV